MKQRFITEYTNYIVRDIKNDPVISDEIKAEKIETIYKYNRALKAGLVTIREYMIKISGGALC